MAYAGGAKGVETRGWKTKTRFLTAPVAVVVTLTLNCNIVNCLSIAQHVVKVSCISMYIINTHLLHDYLTETIILSLL